MIVAVSVFASPAESLTVTTIVCVPISFELGVQVTFQLESIASVEVPRLEVNESATAKAGDT